MLLYEWTWEKHNRSVLLSERVLGEWVRTHVNSKGKIPSTGKKKISSEEDRTHDAASSRTVSPTHYQLRYFGPRWVITSQLEPDMSLLCGWALLQLSEPPMRFVPGQD